VIELQKRRVIRQSYILDAVAGKRVLDIGCVAADELMELHKQIRTAASDCVGMDIVAADGVVQADAQDFDFDEPFEVIVAGEVIEHLGNVKGFLDSIFRNLVPGGRLIITTPNPYSIVALRKACAGGLVSNDPYHVALFDPVTLQHLLIQNVEEELDGIICYYEETNPSTLIYRLNKSISALVPSFSCGVLLDVQRALGRR